MVQFFQAPKQPTAAELIGSSFGQGLNQGLGQAIESYYKNQQTKSLMDSIFGPEEAQQPPPNQPTPNTPQVGRIPGVSKPTSMLQEELPPIQQPDQTRPMQRRPTGPREFTDRQLQKMLLDPRTAKLAETELQRRQEREKAETKLQHAKELKHTESETKRADKFLDTIEESRQNLYNKKQSLATARTALEETDDVGVLSRSNLAQIFKIPGLASKEATIFNAAAKEFFLSDLSRVLGRPNQFLETTLKSALLDVGKSKEANELILDYLDMAIGIEEARINAADQLDTLYREQGIPPPGNIAKRVDDLIKPIYREKEKTLVDKIQAGRKLEKQRAPQSSNTIPMKGPDGEIYDIPRGEVIKAQGKGFKKL